MLEWLSQDVWVAVSSEVHYLGKRHKSKSEYVSSVVNGELSSHELKSGCVNSIVILNCILMLRDVCK